MAIETEDVMPDEAVDGEIVEDDPEATDQEGRSDENGWTVFPIADPRFSPDGLSEFRRGGCCVRPAANGHYRMRVGNFRVQLSADAAEALEEADAFVARFFGEGEATEPKKGRK